MNIIKIKKNPVNVFNKLIFQYISQIKVYYQQQNIQLKLNLCNKNKLFFIDNNQTIDQFETILQKEYPDEEVKIQTKLDRNLKLVDFLQFQQNDNILIQTRCKQLQLKNQSPENLREDIEKLKNDDIIGEYHRIRENLINNDINNSCVGPLSYYISNLNGNLSKKNGKVSVQELQQELLNSLSLHESYSEEKIRKLESEIVKIDEQISRLEKEKADMIEKGEKKIKIYLKSIVCLSTIQLSSFYYMIFHVDWLGWDIIEPLTFSFNCLTLFLALRYYQNHTLNREWTNMLNHSSHQQILNNNNNTQNKQQFLFLNQQIQSLNLNKNAFQLQIDMIYQSKNYYQMQYHYNPLFQ